MATVQETPQFRVVKRSTMSLVTPLSPKEFIQRARDLAQTTEDMGELEKRHEMLKKQMKSEQAEIEAKRAVLSTIVARGEEYRDVEVEERIYAGDKKCLRVRLDTGEIIHERALTAEEQQETLPFAEPPSAPVEVPVDTAPAGASA